MIQLVATTTIEPSSASSSFSSNWTTQGVTSNGILSATDSVVCAGSPGLEPLVEGACSLSGEGVKEHGSGSKVSVTSSTCKEMERLKDSLGCYSCAVSRECNALSLVLACCSHLYVFN